MTPVSPSGFPAGATAAATSGGFAPTRVIETTRGAIE